MALVMDTPAHPVEELGVTKLDKTWQCGHMFCRRDISKWIGSGHDSCPMCRRPLLEAQPDAQPNADADDQTPQAQEAPPPAAAAAQHARAYADFARGMMELQRAMSADGETIPEGLLFEQFSGSFPGAGTGIAVDSSREEREEGDRREFSGMYS
ncbi:hypothetical protein GALMADRAFT_250427 [Galerina marginata CBS 339.88]|uniref:Zinc finger C3HC4 RING-type domain-containing protein n=1 Tax=Galerina marginata (strain CBS 339.88) TaxID=685588 RepID=A0A067T664_GALM3|nr:hypothetical protein GALMADRAFT_250427 [Galerina marginata CBS 339.88]